MSTNISHVSAKPNSPGVFCVSLMLGGVLLMNGLMGMEPNKAREERARAMVKLQQEEQAKAEAPWMGQAGNTRVRLP